MQEELKMPFQGGYQKFKAIPKQQRQAFNRKVFELPPNPEKPPYNFTKEYKEEGKFTYQGHELHYYFSEQTKEPKAVLINVHGMNDHSLYSGYLTITCAEKNPGLNVFAFDQLNFGKSQGPFRGQIVSIDDSIQQVEEFIKLVKSRYQNDPKVYLSGESYGSAIAFKLAATKPEKIAGIIMLAPAIRDLQFKTPWLKKFGKMLGWLTPRLLFVPGAFNESSKYNSEHLIKSDPLFYSGLVVPRSARTVLNAMEEVSQMYGQLTVPYITFQPGVDKLVDTFAGLDLEEQSLSKDKTTVYCQNAWHFLAIEEEIEGIAWQTAHWLKQRI